MSKNRLKITDIRVGNILRHRNYKSFKGTSGFYKVMSVNYSEKWAGLLCFESDIRSRKHNYKPRLNIIKESTLTSNYMFVSDEKTEMFTLLYGFEDI